MLVAPPVPLKPRINTVVGDEQVCYHVKEHQIDDEYPSCVSINPEIFPTSTLSRAKPVASLESFQQPKSVLVSKLLLPFLYNHATYIKDPTLKTDFSNTINPRIEALEIVATPARSCLLHKTETKRLVADARCCPGSMR
jgi:hypothetical protein